MNISSYSFLFIFFPLLVILHSIAKPKIQNTILLIFNLVFILYTGKTSLFVIFSLFTYYLGALLIESLKLTHSRNRLKMVFWFIIILNLSLLVFFKYKNMLIANAESPLYKLVIPIGISFYTFQGISYLSDVTFNNEKAEKSIVNFSVYFAFFLTITSGPITKYSDINQELSNRLITFDNISDGLVRFIFGLFQKVYLSTVFAQITDLSYGTLYKSGASTGLSWLAALSFMFQLYFDFNGYTDMVLGIGKILGFNLPENFNYPYLANTFSDFWNRWHMSLTKWFKKYIYIPLGGNRKGVIRTIFNMSIVWLITGIWHGSTILFITWGMYNFIIILFERFVLKENIYKIPKFLRHIITLLLISIGWIIFRSENLEQAFLITKNLLIFDSNRLGYQYLATYTLTNIGDWILAILLITPSLKNGYKKLYTSESKILQVIAILLIIALFVVSLSFVFSNTYQSFIYQQF